MKVKTKWNADLLGFFMIFNRETRKHTKFLLTIRVFWCFFRG